MTHELSAGLERQSHTSENNQKDMFRYEFYIESFGVKIGFKTNSPDALEAVKKAVAKYLPDCFTEIERQKVAHRFKFVWNKRERDTLYRNGEKMFSRERRETSVDSTASRIRLTVAEFAPERVFIHAGVVAWKGKGIVLPARSFRGKTSLTLALVKRGAVYYSDEYAIFDRYGFLQPFPKMLSVRGIIDERKQVDLPVEDFGGAAGTEKIRAGMILITEYKERAHWKPQVLTPAQGVIETLSHSVAIRQNPNFTLEVMQKVAQDAVFVKSKRGDVSKQADAILQFIDANL